MWGKESRIWSQTGLDQNPTISTDSRLTSGTFSVSQTWWPRCKIDITIPTLQGCYVQKKLLTVIVHYQLGWSGFLSLWGRHWKISFLLYEGWRGEGMYHNHTGDLYSPQRRRFIASERLLLHFDHLCVLPQCLPCWRLWGPSEKGAAEITVWHLKLQEQQAETTQLTADLSRNL